MPSWEITGIKDSNYIVLGHNGKDYNKDTQTIHSIRCYPTNSFKNNWHVGEEIYAGLELIGVIKKIEIVDDIPYLIDENDRIYDIGDF